MVVTRWQLVAFESNRICGEIDGQTYAIFIQDAKGMRPAAQVTDCNWNIQHPKWFPPRKDGRTSSSPQFRHRVNHLGSPLFDVSRFVGER
jgi:hypothetical protein